MLSLPYLGGFFDADGSVSLGRFNKLTKKKKIRSTTYAPLLSFSQSDKGFLEEVGRFLDGSVHLHTAKGSVNSHGIRVNRDNFNLLWSHKAAVRVATVLLPHTFVKREELRAVIEFHVKWNNYTKGWGRSDALSPEYLSRKQEVIDAGDACRELLSSLRHNKNTVIKT